MRSLICALCIAALASVAHAEEPAPPAQASPEPPRALHEPVRLTVGASSELMGVLAPEGDALYFVSDASGSSDVMRQKPLERAPVAISSGLGDAIRPELSPDGKRIAYISFENDSTGDVCFRAIERDGVGRETCIARPDSAELSVLWWDTGSLALLSRAGLHGNFVLERVPVEGGAPRTLLARNMVAPALSPDRRWLAYIPVDKATQDVGVTFSQRTGVGVALARLDAPGEPLTYVPRLPGVTGSVAFSARGDSLMFVQFLNDTNRDGTVDGDDNAVIFRVSFRAGAAQPIDPEEEAEQLTSARWDCHYPAPSARLLIASCSHEGSLDVYALPLAGAVPREWEDARLVREIAAARDAWTRLLLAARRLALAKSPADKEAIVMQTMIWHLELGEYESTVYDAEQRLVSPTARAWGRLVAELARHRRTDLALIRGETSEAYIESERARAASLAQPLPSESPRLALLRALVIGEIQDDIGDKARALATFRALDLARLDDPLLAPLVARRAERLYRLRADRAELLRVYRTLASLPALAVSQRLAYAQRFVDELGRGRTRAERARALQRERSDVGDGSELSLLLDVEAALLTLDDARQEEVRKAIFELYKKNRDPDRRRALVLDTLRAAAKLGNEYLQYQFVTSWVSSLRREQPERKYAERLYNDIVLDRAYGEGRQGERAESRGYFYGATVATDALEAHVGYIEARLAEGGAGAEAEIDRAYAQRFADAPGGPIPRFVRAYRLARTLPAERDLARHEQVVSEALALLAEVAEVMPKQPQVHQVWGFVLHQRARRTGSREAAVDANRQYLLALDLARSDERLTATLLHRLGLLQASLGNHGLAVRYLKQRDELPHVRPREELGLRVALARSAWHTGDAALAREQLRLAEKLLAAHDGLAPYAPLVADRLGLALADTGDARAARAEYERLASLLRADAAALPVNRLKAQLGVAASALRMKDPKAALAALTEADRLLAESAVLTPAPAVLFRRSLTDDYRYAPLQYRALVAGLRAVAARELGDLRGARTATEARIALLDARLKESEADEDRIELAQAELQLATLHYRLGDLAPATEAVERGLALSDAYNESTGSELNDVELALVQAYAELRLFGNVPAEAMRRDLEASLRRVYDVLSKYRNPRLFRQRFLFETYLAELALKSPR